MIPHLAAFYASEQAAKAGNPAQRLVPQREQQIFLTLPVQTQRQVHANYMAKMGGSSNTTSALRRPPSAFHPNLAAPARPVNQISAAAVRSAPSKDGVKRLRIEVPYQGMSGDAAAARRREERPMRHEIARLMYASGDVPEPSLDSVDYMEDLVTEFLADLCRPVPPIRASVNAPRQPVPLTAEILRHRLSSHPYLKKYLERWDHMTYMSVELQRSGRAAQPSHQDLIASVGKGFLGLDETEPAAGTKRRPAEEGEKRRGRPPKNPEERKKPGPKKGWKKNLDPNAPPKKRAAPRPYKKKDRAPSASVAPSPSKPLCELSRAPHVPKTKTFHNTC